MIRKRFVDLGGRSGISWLHRCLFVGALIGAWQVIALDRANVYRNNRSTSAETLQAPEPLLPLSGPLDFEATAYCDYGITKSGAQTAPGIAAADPSVLPLGSLIFVENSRYRGVFRIMDTGRLVKGRIIDIYMTRYDDAVNFGRQPIKVSVLQYGSSASPVLRAAK
jgi:3D (Asp-Asp-Asp) domain-containing protein